MAAQAATRLTAPDRTAQLQDNAQPSCRTHPPCAAPTTSSIFAHLPRQAPAAGSLAACQVGSCSSSLRRAANSNTTASKLTFRAVKRDRIEEQPPITGSARRGSTCPSPLSHAGLSMSRRPASAACATGYDIDMVPDTLARDALGVHGPRQPASRLARPPAEFESFSLRRHRQARRFALVLWRLTLRGISSRSSKRDDGMA